MRIIISPAKKMNIDTDTLPAMGTPVFLEEAGRILGWLQERTYEELKKLWRCNDKIAEQNFRRIQEMDLGRRPELMGTGICTASGGRRFMTRQRERGV